MSKKPKLLTAKQLPEFAGFSKSYFDKARLGNYGPPFLCITGSGKTARIFYREDDVLDWLAAGECNAEGRNNG